MRKYIILLFVLMLVVPAFGKQNVGFGFGLLGDATGIIFLVPSNTKVDTEIVAAGYISDDYYNLRVGGRALYDLGQKGMVERYTGIGAGMAFSSNYDYQTNLMKNATNLWGQVFIGTKVVWNSKFLTAPIKFRSEVGLTGNNLDANLFTQTYIGVGIEYEF